MRVRCKKSLAKLNYIFSQIMRLRGSLESPVCSSTTCGKDLLALTPANEQCPDRFKNKKYNESGDRGALLSVYLAQDVSPNSLNGSSCSTDTLSTKASASLNLVVSQQLPR